MGVIRYCSPTHKNPYCACQNEFMLKYRSKNRDQLRVKKISGKLCTSIKRILCNKLLNILCKDLTALKVV